MRPFDLPTRERAAVAVFAASLLLYLSLRSLRFNFDGVACAIAVELSDFKHLVHGNHLAYGILAWLFDGAWRLLGYRGQAMPALQTLDALLGAAGAAVFASLLRRAGRSGREAALGAAALAVSHAWWFWSLEAQVYMLGALFAALAAREALSDAPRPAVVGAWEAAAALGHVGHLMAAPALAWALAGRRGRRSLPAFLGTLAALLLAAYAAAGLLAVRPRSLDELRLWLLGSAALGPGRTFLWHSTSISETFSAWGRMTLRIFCEFVGRPGAAWAAGVGLAALPPAAAALGAARGGRAARFWLAWLAGYAALYLAWEPFTIVYRVSDLIGLWALAMAGLQSLRPGVRAAALAAWILLAGAYNLFFVVRPAADPASNADLVEARWTGARVPADAWVLATGPGQVYIPYFERRRPLSLRYVSSEPALFAKLDELAARGEEAYVTDRTLEAAGLRESLSRYGLEETSSGAGLTLYRVRKAASRKGRAKRG